MEALIRWFVDRPLVINMIMALVFLLGFMTISDMRYEYNPRVDMGVVNITTVKAGAGPEEVELAITLPLEEELLEVEGIKKLYSNSMESLSVITLNLDLDAADKQEIMRDIQQAVDRAVARLPSDLLEKPLVESLSTLVTPVMEVYVTGDMPEAVLRDVSRNLQDGLREVDGVASVERVGYRRPEVRIMLDIDKLARLGISHDEIIHAIRSRNLAARSIPLLPRRKSSRWASSLIHGKWRLWCCGPPSRATQCYCATSLPWSWTTRTGKCSRGSTAAWVSPCRCARPASRTRCIRPPTSVSLSRPHRCPRGWNW